jgi:hypothetical protein
MSKSMKETNNFVYSKTFMLKSRYLEISKICPVEITSLDIILEYKDITIEIHNSQNDHKIPKWQKNKNIRVWANIPPDIKRIKGILNKLTEDNYERMIEETKTFNYRDPEVITFIFKKIIDEPFFSDLYAKFCNSLEDIHDIINERCIIEFNKMKHKNLGKFIGELYKIGLITDINSFITVLMEDIDNIKLEILCKIITTIGPKDVIFNDVLTNLDSMKNNFSSRFKFMILDLIDNKNS